jgi:maltose alpha-D-glucosyltransferase/alpha-amylase
MPEDLERWAQRTKHAIRDSLALLERQITSRDFPRDRVAEAQALVRRREHYIGWIDEIVDDVGDAVTEGMLIRIHGDYHLGQVLRAASGDFMIIDFEGEPSKSLAERREKASPLRDVAGMLRSLAYAAATLATSVERTIDAPTRELRAARWERDVRQAFLAGYLGERDALQDRPELFPDDDQHVRQLVALFETEKAFYELAYELNNRPSWVWIPMRGIAKLFVTR